jgi:hypothetical protein
MVISRGIFACVWAVVVFSLTLVFKFGSETIVHFTPCMLHARFINFTVHIRNRAHIIVFPVRYVCTIRLSKLQ